jgi:hypothetical protein
MTKTPSTQTVALPATRSWLFPGWVQGLLLFGVAFGLRAVTALAGYSSGSEVLFLGRSQHYINHLLELDFPRITSVDHGRATMPGITTSIVGGITRVLWGGARDLGVTSYPGQLYSQSRSALILSELLMSAATAGLIVLLWWVLSRWSTRTVATTAALLLATEPAIVFDGAKLTTDPFLTLFGAIAAFALAAALDVPSGRQLTTRQRRVMAMIAGVGVGGALLSKLIALSFGPFLAGLVIYAGVRAYRRRESVGNVVLLTAIALGVALLMIVVLWPASWAATDSQLRVLERTARMGSDTHHVFFLGEVTANPSPVFYVLTVPLRMTPWLFLASIPAAVVALRVRALRGFAVVALLYAVVPAISIVSAQAKFVRYSYPLWPTLAVLVGLLVQQIAVWGREGGVARSRALELVAVGAMTGVVVYAFLVVPYGGVYTNPLLGGAPVAEQVMNINDDLQAESGYYIQDRDGDLCGSRRIWTNSFRKFFPCGQVVGSLNELGPGDYVVLSDTNQRGTPGAVRAFRHRTRHIATVKVRGVEISEILQVK